MSCIASESVNCLVTNSRTCSLERVSIFGGRLNLRPTAFSIIGTDWATSSAYGPVYCGFWLSHADTSVTSPLPARTNIRLSSTIISSCEGGGFDARSETRNAQIPVDDGAPEKQRDERGGRKKDAERKLSPPPISVGVECQLRLAFVVGKTARRQRVYDAEQNDRSDCGA